MLVQPTVSWWYILFSVGQYERRRISDPSLRRGTSRLSQKRDACQSTTNGPKRR